MVLSFVSSGNGTREIYKHKLLQLTEILNIFYLATYHSINITWWILKTLRGSLTKEHL